MRIKKTKRNPIFGGAWLRKFALVLGILVIVPAARAQQPYPLPTGLLTADTMESFKNFFGHYFSQAEMAEFGHNFSKTLVQTEMATGMIFMVNGQNSTILSKGSGVNLLSTKMTSNGDENKHIESGTYVATAYHVIEQLIKSPMRVKGFYYLPGYDEPFTFGFENIVASSEEGDSALLKLANFKPEHVLSMFSRETETGLRTLTSGYAGGVPEISHSLGNVVSVYTNGFRSSSVVLPGMSGGPTVAFDQRGRLLGLIGVNSLMEIGSRYNVTAIETRSENPEEKIHWEAALTPYSINSVLLNSFKLEDQLEHFLDESFRALVISSGQAKKPVKGYTMTTNITTHHIYQERLRELAKRADRMNLKGIDSPHVVVQSASVNRLVEDLHQINLDLLNIYLDQSSDLYSRGGINVPLVPKSEWANLKAALLQNPGSAHKTVKNLLSMWKEAILVSKRTFVERTDRETKLFSALILSYDGLADLVNDTKKNQNTFAERANHLCFMTSSRMTNLLSLLKNQDR